MEEEIEYDVYVKMKPITSKKYTLLDVDSKIKELQDWIYKNNTIPFKDMFTNKRFKEALENEEDKDVKEAVEDSLSNMRLVTTDGGWVNVIELNKKIEEIFG